MISRKLSFCETRTYLGIKWRSITSQVSSTISHAVDLPNPNRAAMARYSIFVPSLQMVTSTLTSSLMDFLSILFVFQCEVCVHCVVFQKFLLSFSNSSPRLIITQTSNHSCPPLCASRLAPDLWAYILSGKYGSEKHSPACEDSKTMKLSYGLINKTYTCHFTSVCERPPGATDSYSNTAASSVASWLYSSSACCGVVRKH